MAEGTHYSREVRAFVTITAVVITAVAGLIAYGILLDWAIDRYEASHEMGTCIRKGWFGREYQVQCQAGRSDLAWGTLIFMVLIPSGLYLVAHIILGRLCVELWNDLGTELAKTLSLEEDYFQIPRVVGPIAGSLWPFLAILIPLQLVGLLIGKVYSSVWFD